MTGFSRSGWRHTDNTRKLMSLKGLGRRHTKESRDRIGTASKNRYVTQETRERNRQAAKRENLSEETLRRRTLSLQKKTIKYDLNYVEIETFESLKIAAKSINSHSSKLSIAIKL